MLRTKGNLELEEIYNLLSVYEFWRYQQINNASIDPRKLNIEERDQTEEENVE